MQRSRSTYTAGSAHMPSTPNIRFANSTRQYGSKTAATKGTTANATGTPCTSDCGMPSEHQVPLSETVCYACGKKGHYKGSRECPKTPSSARLHAMGTETEMEEPSFADNPEMPEDIFDGKEDFGPTEEEPETDDTGIGVVIASIHVEEEDDEVIIYAATMATSNSEKTKNDEKVATYGETKCSKLCPSPN